MELWVERDYHMGPEPTLEAWRDLYGLTILVRFADRTIFDCTCTMLYGGMVWIMSV